jgi:hypothetical protein
VVSVYDVGPRILSSQQSKIDVMPLRMKIKEPTLQQTETTVKETSSITRRWRVCLSAKRTCVQREGVKDRSWVFAPYFMIRYGIFSRVLGDARYAKHETCAAQSVARERRLRATAPFQRGPGAETQQWSRSIGKWDLKTNNYNRWICVSISFQKRELAKAKRVYKCTSC